MDVLEKGAPAPAITLQAENGETLNLGEHKTPVVIVFFHPVVFASRHVVGYLRRLPQIAPNVPVWLISTATPEETKIYTQDYLENFPIVQNGCQALKAFGGRFVPATYLFHEGKVEIAFTGFHRLALNTLGRRAAELSGGKPKDLVTDTDNKGEYELAEVAPCQ